MVRGATGGDGPELQHRAEPLLEAAQLASDFPLLRPESRSFDRWLDRLAAVGEAEDEDVDRGIAAIGRLERRRIVRAARALGAPWQRVVAELEDGTVAEHALLAGAVAAGLKERKAPDHLALELLEEREDLREDPAEALSFALEACDLWSVVEAERLDRALAELPDELDDYEYEAVWHRTIAAEARRLARGPHRRRLEVLVRRLGAQLPLDGYPLASDALAQACAAFVRVPVVRERLLALLLADTLGPLRHIQLGLAA
jgi:hypothetical protein